MDPLPTPTAAIIAVGALLVGAIVGTVSLYKGCEEPRNRWMTIGLVWIIVLTTIAVAVTGENIYRLERVLYRAIEKTTLETKPGDPRPFELPSPAPVAPSPTATVVATPLSPPSTTPNAVITKTSATPVATPASFLTQASTRATPTPPGAYPYDPLLPTAPALPRIRDRAPTESGFYTVLIENRSRTAVQFEIETPTGRTRKSLRSGRYIHGSSNPDYAVVHFISSETGAIPDKRSWNVPTRFFDHKIAAQDAESEGVPICEFVTEGGRVTLICYEK